MKLELLWFDGCPNHHVADQLLQETLKELGIDEQIELVEVPDLETGVRTKFAGSPSIRINGIDIDPTFEDTGDYTPRCRVYMTSAGFKGVPEKAWIVDALQTANSD
ncbi:MAG TPA: DUF2703 domain-containing protein [Dehalococcoidia bacterium]|jgi:hypothetical protein|nr:DUF2703 domain-containing protein [Dehalococcoidia bacterium]HIK89742.1 DUF2703 domain-containing protein [Dehalococcoidia bacterium]